MKIIKKAVKRDYYREEELLLVEKDNGIYAMILNGNQVDEFGKEDIAEFYYKMFASMNGFVEEN